MVYTDGDAALSAICNITLVILNIVFSAILAYRYGAWGIGTATFISYSVGILILLCHFFKKTNSIHFRLYFSKKLTFETITKSLPHASEYFFKAALLAFLNFFVVYKYGENGIVVLSAAILLINFEAVFSGIPEAISPIVGVYIGEKNETGIRKIMGIATKASILEGTAFTAATLVLAPFIPLIIGIETPSHIALSTNAVRIVTCGAIFESLIRLYAGYYTYIFKKRLSFLTNFFNRILFPFVLVLFFSKVLGMNGVWISLSLSGLFTSAVISIIIVVRYGKNIFPLLYETSKDILIFDCLLNEKKLIELRDKVAELLPKEYPSELKYRMLLAIEEFGIMIADYNNGKKVLLEFDIWKGNAPKIIIRYSGKLIDVTDTGMPKSFREYIFDCLQLESIDSKYLMTTGQNRVVLKFRTV